MNFALVSFSSLFSVISPISAAPIFVSMTRSVPLAERRKAAFKACLAAGAILLVFQIAGGVIFSFFGITVPAFQIAGGILFTLISIKTLYDAKEADRGGADADPSVVPLGIPTIAGPGAITTVMVLVGQASGPRAMIALSVAVVVNILLTLALLLAAPRVVSMLGVTGSRIVDKVMSLLTAAIGVQFIINGVTSVALHVLHVAKG
ncbi:MAG: MarC family protein [Acidobacteriota bacterium]